jgi:CDP-2,3-bis-(O-geranylgeranyl)-sn-glycerol synthase
LWKNKAKISNFERRMIAPRRAGRKGPAWRLGVVLWRFRTFNAAVEETTLEKLSLLLLIVTANGAPILLEDLLGRRFAWPIDGGLRFSDGRRLLGESATLRGLAGAVVCTSVVGSLLGFPIQTGAVIGLFAMAGDALSCFVKRRLGMDPGDRAIGLDQIPESLLPLLAVMESYTLDWLDVALLVLAFTGFSLVVSRVLFRLKLRKRPH